MGVCEYIWGPIESQFHPIGFKLEPDWVKLAANWFQSGPNFIHLGSAAPLGARLGLETSRALKSEAVAQLLRLWNSSRQPGGLRKWCYGSSLSFNRRFTEVSTDVLRKFEPALSSIRPDVRPFIRRLLEGYATIEVIEGIDFDRGQGPPVSLTTSVSDGPSLCALS